MVVSRFGLDSVYRAKLSFMRRREICVNPVLYLCGDVCFGSQAVYFRQFYSTAAVEHKADAQYMLSRKTESERLLLL
jgi:hypothetical protein